MTLDRSQRAFIFKTFFAILSLTIAFYILVTLNVLIVPMIVGALLAYLFKPLLGSFRKHWLPDGVRVFGLVSLFVGFLFAITWMVRESLPGELETLELKTRIQYKFNENKTHYLQLKRPKEERNLFVNMFNEQFTPLFKDIDQYVSLTPVQEKQFQDYYDQKMIPEKYYEYFQSNVKEKKIENKRETASLAAEVKKNSVTLSIILDIFSIWIIMPLVFVFLLFDKGEIYRYGVQFVPNRFFELTLTVFEEVNLAIGKYLRGTLLECLLVGLTMFMGLFFIGFDLQAAFLIALFGGLVSAIPFVGTLVALVMGLAYAMIAENAQPLIPFMTQNDLMIGVCVVMAVTHFLDNLIYQPLVVGSAVNLHPLVVILGVMGGSIIFGFTGMMFAIPAIVIIKVSVETLFQGLKDYHII